MSYTQAFRRAALQKQQAHLIDFQTFAKTTKTLFAPQ
jgi:hypothetical protein